MNSVKLANALVKLRDEIADGGVEMNLGDRVVVETALNDVIDSPESVDRLAAILIDAWGSDVEPPANLLDAVKAAEAAGPTGNPLFDLLQP